MRWRAQPFYQNDGAVSGVLYKNNFVSDLLGSQHLLEILQTSLTVKNSENMIKKLDVLKNVCDGQCQFFFKMKEKYRVSCVKILFWYIIRKLAFI